jgi:hypothetical protein
MARRDGREAPAQPLHTGARGHVGNVDSEYGGALPQWRPLSARGQADSRFDTLHEGLPTWIHASAVGWIQPTFQGEFGDRLATLQNVLRLELQLNWQSQHHAYTDLLNRIQQDGELALDVLDYLVYLVDESHAKELGGILTLGGSAWEVTPDGSGRHQLTRRAVGPVVESIEAMRTPSQRAHQHLVAAWSALMGRNPNPSTAYGEAIRAVEAAAKPVVTRDDPSATLGKIIAAIRDKPSKWTVVLAKSSPEQVADMADLIWQGQLDRHGSDDPDAPLSVSQEEADAAFHIALALVRLFVSCGIKPVA